MRKTVREREAEAFLEGQRRLAQLLASVDPAVLGDRIRVARQHQGKSIREIAAAAAVSKTSVVRLEGGGSCEPNTVAKICAALGLHVEALATPSSANSSVVVHRHADDRWYDLVRFSDGPLGGLDRPLTPAERKRFAGGAEGKKIVPLNVLKSRLPQGRLLSTIIELRGPSPVRSHPGEEWVYVLSGKAIVTINGTPYALEQGESLIFRSAEPHSYAPAEADSSQPATLISVRLDDRGKESP